MNEDGPKTAARVGAPGDIAGGAGPRLVGATIDPVGPLNVFNEKIAAADAINRAIATKEAYDATHPAPATLWTPPDMTPIGEAISAGKPIAFDPTKFVIDRGPRDRVLRKRRF